MVEHKVCLRCGRKLKSEQSRQLGYGEICWKKREVGDRVIPLFNVDIRNVNIQPAKK